MLFRCRYIRKIFIVSILFLISIPVVADDFKTTDVTTIHNEAKKIAKQIKVDNKYMPSMKIEAKKANEYFHSKQCQTRINAYKKQILNSKLFINADNKYVPKKYSKIKPGILDQNEKLYIFISSSMPVATIRRYVQDVDKLHDPNVHIILRGFIGGIKYLKPTVKFFAKCAKIDPLCDGPQCKLYNVGFNVNPLPFRKYHIDRVPAVVYVPYEQQITPENITEPTKYYKIYGDAKLEYVLNLIYEKSKSNSLKSLIEKLKTGFYQH